MSDDDTPPPLPSETSSPDEEDVPPPLPSDTPLHGLRSIPSTQKTIAPTVRPPTRNTSSSQAPSSVGKHAVNGCLIVVLVIIVLIFMIVLMTVWAVWTEWHTSNEAVSRGLNIIELILKLLGGNS